MSNRDMIYANLTEIVELNKIRTTDELVKYLVNSGVIVIDINMIELIRDLYIDNFID